MPLEKFTDYDDRVIEPGDLDWPVEVPPFRDERFRTLWHRVQYLALRGAQGGALGLPRPLRSAVVNTLAALGRVFDRRHTEAARTFISAAFPEYTAAELNAVAKEAWRHLMRVALVSEGISKHVMGGRLGDHYDVYMDPAVRELLSRRQAVILITGHVGHWEASCPGITTIGFRPVYAIGKAPRNDYVAQHIQRMREGQGMRLISRKGAMQTVPQAMRGGSHVGMLLDHRPRQKPLIAPFFGRPAGCDRSAGVLIRRVKAPLVFYGCYGAAGTDPLRDWRFELRFARVIHPEELRGLDPVEVATRVNRELEALIRYRPKEVFWLHDRFRDAPATFDPSGDSQEDPGGSASDGTSHGAARPSFGD